MAEKLIGETCARRKIVPGTVTLHADRGAAMISNQWPSYFVDPCITKSHSTYFPDDNPFLRRAGQYLEVGRASQIASAPSPMLVASIRGPGMNTEHHHSGIGLLTPADIHLGRAAALIAPRADFLAPSDAANPERFVRGMPHPAAAPTTRCGSTRRNRRQPSAMSQGTS